MTDRASFSLFFSGLDGGIARIGMHTTIGFTTFPVGGTITQKWGESPGGSEYGSGANPTDFSASDGGNLYLEVTRDGETASAVVPVRHVAPTLTGALSDQTFYGDNGFSAHDVSSEFEGNNISFSLVVAVAGFSIDPGTGVLTIDKSVTKLITNQSVTVRASNSGGYAEDTLAVTVAAINLSIVGLDGSVARIGSHGTIGYSLTPSSGDISQKWGSTPGGAEYGTFANPSDFAASDSASLFLEVTRDGSVVSASAPVRYAAPVAAGGLGSWTIQQGAVGSVLLDASVDFAADGETYDAYPTGFPIGTALPTGFTFDTVTGELAADRSAVALQTDTSITIECRNSGGSAVSLLLVTVTEAVTFDITTDAEGFVVGTADTGGGTFTISKPPEYAGIYPADFTQLLLDGTPLNVIAPTTAGSDAIGESRSRALKGIWLSNPNFDPTGITITEQWTRDEVDISGATDPDLYVLVPADGGTTVRLKEIATGLDSAQSFSASSVGLAIPDVFNPLVLGSSLKHWFSAADLSSLWQDSDGTAPVTADGQEVKRWSDRANGSYFFDETGQNGGGAGPLYKTDGTYQWMDYDEAQVAARLIGGGPALNLGPNNAIFMAARLNAGATWYLAATDSDTYTTMVGRAQNGQSSFHSGNSGSPVFYVNGMVLPTQDRNTLHDNTAIATDLVVHAEAIDFSADALWSIAGEFYPGGGGNASNILRGRIYEYVIVDMSTMTAQDATDLITWLNEQMPGA